MADSTPAPAAPPHTNWRNVLVDWGSLAGLLVTLLVAQATAYLSLYGQLSAQAEHLRSIDQQLVRIDKHIEQLDRAIEAASERDRQLFQLLAERDLAFTKALAELQLSVARIEQRLGTIEQRIGGKR